MSGAVDAIFKPGPLGKEIGLGAQPKFQTPIVEPIESVTTVTDAAGDARKKKRLKPTGRSNALLAGVANALKERLGQ